MYSSDDLYYVIHYVVYLMNKGSSWPNGSYFRSTPIKNNHISCIYCEGLDGTNDGGWIYPSGASCNSTTSPIQCNDVTTDSPTNITLQRKAGISFGGMELVYRCCLPNDCSDSSSDVIIANIYGKS